MLQDTLLALLAELSNLTGQGGTAAAPHSGICSQRRGRSATTGAVVVSMFQACQHSHYVERERSDAAGGCPRRSVIVFAATLYCRRVENLTADHAYLKQQFRCALQPPRGLLLQTSSSRSLCTRSVCNSTFVGWNVLSSARTFKFVGGVDIRVLKIFPSALCLMCRESVPTSQNKIALRMSMPVCGCPLEP